LLVDRDTFPSDILSTHYIQPQGVAQMRSWGLLPALEATDCPPLEKTTFHLGDLAISPPRPPGMPPAYCPRRTVLDKILVDAAREAGAEVREGFSVREVLIKDGRAVGVRGRAKGADADAVEHATIVVGADGMHSMVARAVGAPSYHERPSYTCGYYTYWSGVEMEGAELYLGEGTGALAFPTNFGQVCVAVARAHAEFAEYRKDIEGNYLRWLEGTAPSLGAQVRAAKREERWVGTADVPNFFRKPYGPGWALVGDAGYHRDPVTGLGIMDAFRDAELVATAIDDGLAGRAPMEEALAAYEQQRNEAALPAYEVTCKLASLPPREEVLALFGGAPQPA
ncbi:MAG TPA: FAD-dependent monooxygenase, partial [Methylomirabilota bacterium]|nr:FAD-dependent monooxygenase [Methylomirabilota bacterium]